METENQKKKSPESQNPVVAKLNKIYEYLKPVKELSRNKQVIITASFFSAIFLGIVVYLIAFSVVNKTSLIGNSYNKQEKNLLAKSLRGEIVSSDGVVLAYSELDESGNQVRVYPYADAFCHSVGYSALDKTGVESECNYYLLNSGSTPLQRAKLEEQGIMPSGNTVNTTIDYNLQMTAHEALGDNYGAVIVTEVKTGRVLVLLSHPTFDPNNIAENWESLVGNEDETELMNRATQGLYPPGSVFKIFTAYEYMKEGGDIPGYTFDCNGSYKYDDLKISCYHGESHGTLDFGLSFAKSCNSSFANIGMSLDEVRFENGLNSLLFNDSLPAVFDNSPVPESTYDISTDHKRMQTSIGQGDTLVSPYHINLITMAIADEGTVMKPYTVDSIVNFSGKKIEENSPQVYRQLLDKDSSDFLRGLMEEVVEKGTASSLKNDIYTVAGKTGSAEYNNRGDSHGWFTGYAPAEDPEIAITVIVEKGGTGSSSAVPLAKKVLDKYFASGGEN